MAISLVTVQSGEVGGSHQNSSSDIGTFPLRTVGGKLLGPATALGQQVSSNIRRLDRPVWDFSSPSGRSFRSDRSDIPYFRATCVAREAGRAPAGSPGKIFSPLFTLKTSCRDPNSNVSLNKTHRYSPSVPSHSITFIYSRPGCTVVHSYVPQ